MTATITQAPAARTYRNSSAEKLSQAIKIHSDRHWQNFRDIRSKLLAEMAGPWYGGERGQDVKGPLNLFYSVTSILLPSLILKPNPCISARRSQFSAFAGLMETAINFLNEQDDTNEVVRNVLLDALYGRGVCLTTIGSQDTGKISEAQGYLMDPGRVCSRYVPEHEFIEDGNVQSEDGISFRGHRFNVPYEWAQDSKLYNSQMLQKVYETTKDKARSLNGTKTVQDAFVEEIGLATVWLPKHNAIVTIGADMDAEAGYLREDGYEGPEEGPYSVLTFMGQPGSTMPVAPMSVVYELQKAMTDIASHIRDQVVNAKEIPVVRPGAEQMAKAAASAKAGEYITGDPSAVGSLKFGVPGKEQYEAVGWFYDFFNRLAGNPDLLGGLSSQARTFGQDQLLTNAAQITLNDKRDRVKRFSRKLIKAKAWHLWHDEFASMDLMQAIPGAWDIPVKWDAKHREGDLLDYAFDVQDYTVDTSSPDARLARVMQIIKGVYIPLAGAGMQQGTQLDVAALAAEVSKMLGIKGLDNAFQQAQPQMAPEINMGGTTINNNAGGSPMPQRPTPGDMGQPQESENGNV